MQDDIVPTPTSFSSAPFVMNAYWSPADLVVSASVIVLDDESNKVLIVREPATNQYRFPWSVNDKDDVGKFLESPFEQITKEVQYRYVIEKRALPRLWREYKNPNATNWRDLEIVPVTCSYNTYDPFFMTIDALYLETDQTRLFMDNMQRLSFWFACRVVSRSWADENVTWMTFDEARTKLRNQENPDEAGCYALEQLVAIWEDPTTHEPAEVVEP